MRDSLRAVVCLAISWLTIVVLVGCQGTDVAPSSDTTSETTSAPTTAPTSAARLTTPRSATTGSAPRGRHSTSGEEQMKDACDGGELPKSDCGRFYADVQRDHIQFN